MQHIDLYISFMLFFILGALVNSLVRMVLDFRAQKQKQRDDTIKSIKSELHELKLEIMKGKF